MRCFIGIDLGSTTTKAVVIDENQNIIGRGITNSRSNYDTAAAVAKTEALINGRFHLFRQALAGSGALNGSLDGFIGQLERDFRSEQYLEQLKSTWKIPATVPSRRPVWPNSKRPWARRWPRSSSA
jgi:benzoyl-CoA reductase subunit A